MTPLVPVYLTVPAVKAPVGVVPTDSTPARGGGGAAVEVAGRAVGDGAGLVQAERIGAGVLDRQADRLALVGAHLKLRAAEGAVQQIDVVELCLRGDRS